MKSTGIVRKVDELGRIVLPIEMRRTLDIGEKDTLENNVEGDNIILHKYQDACVFCDSTKGILKLQRSQCVVLTASANCRSLLTQPFGKPKRKTRMIFIRFFFLLY